MAYRGSYGRKTPEQMRHETRVRQVRRDSLAAYEVLQAIEDDELGAIGADFIDKTIQSGVREEMDFNLKVAAIYEPFRRASGFLNTIFYGKSALEGADRVFVSKVHESTHAAQFLAAPCLHADFSNSNSAPLLLAPRDYVLSRLVAEKDAQAKEILMAGLAYQQGHIKNPILAKTVFDPQDFKGLRTQFGDIEQALRFAVNQGFSKPDRKRSLNRLYQVLALQDFANGYNRLYPAIKDGKYRFVRLETADLSDIGGSFGPNTVDIAGIKDEFSARAFGFEPDVEDALQRIESHIVYDNYQDLPTLAAALKDYGLTQQDFLNQSRVRTDKSAGSKNPRNPLAL